MFVIDHNHPAWVERVNKHGRINGVQTYSEEIVKWHLPQWSKHLPSSATVCTVLQLNGWEADPHSLLCVQYLHNFPLTGDTRQTMHNIIDKHPFHWSSILFVTSYWAQHCTLSKLGYWSMYLPMTIDPPQLTTSRKFGWGQAVYFGNLNVMPRVKKPKMTVYNQLKKGFQSAGWKLDTVGGLSKQEALEKVAQYEYAVAVSRCYQECQAMGIKTMVAGQRFGGLVMSAEDFNQQIQANIDGRISTYDDDIERCLLSFGEVHIQYRDIRDAEILDEIYDRIGSALNE